VQGPERGESGGPGTSEAAVECPTSGPGPPPVRPRRPIVPGGGNRPGVRAYGLA
jgi:hypothetical protein